MNRKYQPSMFAINERTFKIRKTLPLVLGIITAFMCLEIGKKLRHANEKSKNFNVENQKPNHTYRHKEFKLGKKQIMIINADKARNTTNSVRVLCYVNTIPATYRRKAMHVKVTWARRCTKYLFMSSAPDEELAPVGEYFHFIKIESIIHYFVLGSLNSICLNY